jgi:[ribosomal protein S5]-alanine N-acetyltransferase
MRPVEATDDRVIHRWASRPEECRFQPWGPNTWEETRAFAAAAAAAWQGGRRRVWLAGSPEHGDLGLGELKLVSGTTREIAYAVDTRHWGRGWGSAIARWLVDLAFAEGAERVQGTWDPRNLASRAVMLRVGMQFEGRMRRTMLLRDGWRDSDLFAITRPTWADARGDARGPA